jgi:hypothetical protein
VLALLGWVLFWQPRGSDIISNPALLKEHFFNVLMYKCPHQRTCIGELVIVDIIEDPKLEMQVDLYWVEQNGTVWTRTEERLGVEMVLDEQGSTAKRQLTDFELEAVEKIIRGTIPGW